MSVSQVGITSSVVTAMMLISCVASILRQGPMLCPYSWLYWLKFLWLLPTAALLLAVPQKFLSRSLLPLYGFVAAFALYCCVATLITGTSYIGQDLYNAFCSVGIAAVSYVYWKSFGSRRNLKIISLTLLVTAVVCSLVILTTQIPRADYSALYSVYFYKNSISLVLLTVMIITILVWMKDRIESKRNAPAEIVFWVCQVIILTCVILSRCRACYLAIFFLCIYCIGKIRSLKIKAIVCGCIIALVVVFLAVPWLYTHAVHELLFAARPLDNLDLFFSNRLGFIADELPLTGLQVLFGKGCVYLDCFPLAIVIQYGVLGASLIYAFLAWVGFVASSHSKSRGSIGLTAFLSFWTLIIISFFEAHVPLGTGVKCFILWMSFGFLLASRRNPEKHIAPQ